VLMQLQDLCVDAAAPQPIVSVSPRTLMASCCFSHVALEGSSIFWPEPAAASSLSFIRSTTFVFIYLTSAS
jgi:hypothetical protein